MRWQHKIKEGFYAYCEDELKYNSIGDYQWDKYKFTSLGHHDLVLNQRQ